LLIVKLVHGGTSTENLEGLFLFAEHRLADPL